MFSLNGKVALVTGGTRGIGSGVAQSLAAAGARIVVTGRNTQLAQKVVDRIRREGGEATAVGCDLADDAEVDGLIASAVAEFGQLDILVNNAGIDADAEALTYPLDAWRRVMRMDLEVPFRLCQAAGAHFLTRGGGVIINMSSVLGLVGLPQTCSYAAAKHGVIGFSRVLALEWAARNIRVNVIAPGLIQTDMTKNVWDSPHASLAIEQIPAGRIGLPKDIGALAVFLASDEADFIHGEVIAVDGGYLAG